MVRENFPKREYRKNIQEGMAICKRCQAVYSNKYWFYNEKLYKENINKPDLSRILCPGCQKVENKQIDGIVILKSEVLKELKAEILNLIKHTYEKEKTKNPLSQIAELKVENNHIEIYTTTQFLAKHLGQVINKAYQGKLEIQKLPRENFIRVNWTK